MMLSFAAFHFDTIRKFGLGLGLSENEEAFRATSTASALPSSTDPGQIASRRNLAVDFRGTFTTSRPCPQPVVHDPFDHGSHPFRHSLDSRRLLEQTLAGLRLDADRHPDLFAVGLHVPRAELAVPLKNVKGRTRCRQRARTPRAVRNRPARTPCGAGCRHEKQSIKIVGDRVRRLGRQATGRIIASRTRSDSINEITKRLGGEKSGVRSQEPER